LERVRSALVTPVKKAASSSTQAAGSPAVHRLWAIGPWVATVTTVILLGVILLMMVDTGRIRAGASGATHPTPTPSPTPLTSPTPLPTPMTGYKLYVYRGDIIAKRDGYYLEYPEDWTARSTESDGASVEIDSGSGSSSDASPTPSATPSTTPSTSGAYTLAIVSPADWSAPGYTAGEDPAKAWVHYVLTNGPTYVPFPGTFLDKNEALPSVTIGGVSWAVGEMMFVPTSGNWRERILVCATIHEGAPYVIILTGGDDQFDQGRTQYFTPMLDSFNFLTPAP
jgi:hypothetical protein